MVYVDLYCLTLTLGLLWLVCDCIRCVCLVYFSFVGVVWVFIVLGTVMLVCFGMVVSGVCIC